MCIVVVFYFKESVHMEAAYGLSITVTMLMTTVLLIFWLWRNRVSKIFIGMFALVYFAIELGFFGANIIKFYKFYKILFNHSTIIPSVHTYRHKTCQNYCNPTSFKEFYNICSKKT